MNTPVSFEIAKLLKEKGFDDYSDKKYIAQCLWQNPNSREKYKNSEIHKNSSDVVAPTISEVVMWLYEKHGIWISVTLKRHSENKHFAYTIRQANGIETYLWGHNSPTEAYEAAIEYTLKNLI